MHFKMQYFDTNSVGKLVTNSVSDIEKIAEVFSQGFFMIVGDVLKMLVVIGVMLYTRCKTICLCICNITIYFVSY